MTHWTRQDLEDHLLEYLYDELEPADRTAFERALPTHPEVAREVQAHQATRLAFRGYARESAPAGLLDDLIAEVEAGGPVAARATAKAPGFWERVRAFLAQPAFAMAFVTLVVAGVGLVASRKGEVPGMPPSAEAQHLPPVAVSDRPAGGVAAAGAVRDEETVAKADLAREQAEATKGTGAMAAPEDGQGRLAAATTGAFEADQEMPKKELEAPAPPAVAGQSGTVDRDGLADLGVDGKLAKSRDAISRGPAVTVPEVAGLQPIGGEAAEGLQQGWFDGNLASKDKAPSAPMLDAPKGAKADDALDFMLTPVPKDVAEVSAKVAPAKPDVKTAANDGGTLGGMRGDVPNTNDGDVAKVQAKPTEARVPVNEPAPRATPQPASSARNENYRGGDAAGRAEVSRVDDVRTLETQTAERKATVTVDDEARKREEKPSPRLGPPEVPARSTNNQPVAPPANATPERLWTLFQQQSAAGAWADAELTVVALAKAEGESARVKQARSELQKRVEAGKKSNTDKLPPDPPAAPNRNTGGK